MGVGNADKRVTPCVERWVVKRYRFDLVFFHDRVRGLGLPVSIEFIFEKLIDRNVGGSLPFRPS